MVVFSECVLKVVDSDQMSVFLAADRLTKTSNERLLKYRSKKKFNHKACVLRSRLVCDALKWPEGIHRSNANEVMVFF